MKKLILLSAMLLFGAVSAFSQLVDKPVYVNPKIGLNYIGYHESFDGFEINNKIGFNVGLDIRLGQGLVYLAPGIHYFQSTNEFSFAEVGDNTIINDGEVKTQSIKVPVLVGLRLVNTDAVNLRLNAGPSFNFPLNIDDGEINVGEGEFNENFKDFSLGAIVGAGVDFSILSFDVGYEYGLSDVLEVESSDGDARSSKTYQWIFTVGLLF